MKAVIVSALAAGAAILGACATAPSDTAAMSGREMMTELAVVAQELRDLDTATRSYVHPQGAEGPVLPRRHVRRSLLQRREELANRREDLREGLAARRESLSADEIRTLIAMIDRELANYEYRGPGAAGVGEAPSRPVLRTQALTTDGWAPMDPNYYASRPGLESAGMRHAQWRRMYRLKKDREELWAALRTHAAPPL